MALLKSLKSLFGGRSKNEPAEPEKNAAPAAPQEPETVPEPPVETPPPPAPEEKKPVPEVTADVLADRLEACKAALGKCGLTAEEIDKYSSALTTMQQAIRGLHAVVDVTSLMDFLNRLFCSGLLLILSCGTPLDRDSAIVTVNDAIKTIPSPTEQEVKIATLQLAILIQTAQILSCNKTVAGLTAKKEEYLKAEKELLKASKAERPEDLTEKEKAYFDQYEQRIHQLSGQIEGADRLVINYNQKIVMLNSAIDTVTLLPTAVNAQESLTDIDDLLEEMPSIADFSSIVEEATQSTDEARARAKAEIKEMKVKLENTTFITDSETQASLEKCFEEVKGPLVKPPETEKQPAETEEEQAEKEQPQTLTE